MKKKLATFCCALLAIGGIQAQPTALQFDGINDFAFVEINQPPTTFSGESFTFEAVIRGVPNGKYATLLSIPQASGNITFGITPDGRPFFGNRDNKYEGEEGYLLDDQCHHLAISIFENTVWFYFDGNPSGAIALQSQPVFANTTAMHLGMSYPDQTTAFEGVLDEVRLWSEARTDADISNWAFTTPNATQWPRYLLLPFWEGTGTISLDPMASPYNFAYWVSSEGADMQWVEPCIEENYEISFKVGQGVLPPCVPSSNSNELICNGGFEQYDSILDTFFVWAAEWMPYLPDLSGNTDIVNWKTAIGNPDFFVVNGIGNLPAPAWPLVSPNPWNGTASGNKAMTALYSQNTLLTPNWSEGIKTELLYNVQPGETYKFSGWFYTGSIWIPWSYAGQNLKVKLKSSQNSSISYNSLPIQSLVNKGLIATNSGWQYITFNFTMPAGNSYDILEVAVETTMNLGSVTNGIYTFVDDLSLQWIPSGRFPQHIETSVSATHGSTNDSFHRRIKTDAANNVYVTGKVSNNPDFLQFGLPVQDTLATNGVEVGSYVAKYDVDGLLQWQKYFDNLQINDFEIMPNGNLFAIGIIGGVNVGQAAPPGITWMQTASAPVSCTGSSPLTIHHYNTDNMFLLEINAATGNQVSAPKAYGGLGAEQGVDVEIIGSKAYIACEIGSATVSYGNQPYPCSTTFGGNLQWQSGPGNSSSKILIYDLVNSAKTRFSAYNPANMRMLDHLGNDLFILSNTTLQKLNISNTSNTASSVNLPLRYGQQNAAQYLHVTSSNDVYLTYPNMMQYNHGLERRSGATLQQTGLKLYEYFSRVPVAVSSKGNDVFVAHAVPDTSLNAETSLAIEKLNLNGNFGDSTWIIISGVYNSRYSTIYSSGDLVFTDLVPFINNKLMFIANFTSLSSNWSFSLGGKSLARSSGVFGDNHTVISTIEDFGSTGSYKQQVAEVESDALLLFPNPTNGIITIRATEAIDQCRVLSATGATLFMFQGQGEASLTFDALNLPSGIYVIEVKCANKVYVKKLVVQ